MKAVKIPLGSVCEYPCPDCGAKLVLRSSKFGPFYGCSKFPACRAAHGAHADGRPLGIPADAATKKMRMAAHEAFDRLWKRPHGVMNRGQAYRWMQATMDMTSEQSHIARFSIEECGRLIAAVGELTGEGGAAWMNRDTG